MTVRIAVLDDYQSVAATLADWSVLDGRAEVTFFHDHLDDADAVVRRLAPFDVVCAMRERTPLTAEIINRLDRLRLICSTGARNASIDVRAAAARDIPVCATGYTPHGAAEHTWALLLAAARHIPAEAASLRAGGWQRHLGADLKGATLGLVGLGNIGAIIARVAQAFSMNVIAWSQNLTVERAEAVGVRAVSKSALFAEADFISVHLVLSARSRGVVGADDLARMKPGAWLINTSRGPLVDEVALIAALQSRQIGGAALDVFDTEPLPADHPFRRLDNVLATPHIGFVTRDTYTIFYRDTVENLVAWLDGSPIRVMALPPAH
jgi:phosphoglycerate dehydrogenase-like enzyme